MDDEECLVCGRHVSSRGGVPSTTTVVEPDPRAEQLRELAGLEIDDTIAPVFAAHQVGRLDDEVVDRFFTRRTVGWRVLLEPYCAGRALVVGTHDESVALSVAEAMDSVWVADTSVASLQATAAVASAEGTDVEPLHATVVDLPFPDGAFDLVVLQCPASELPKYLSEVSNRLAPDGRLALVVDGWIRELGLTALLGLAPSQRDGLGTRIAASIDAIPARVTRALDRHGLAVERTYGLLSRGRHENELAFDAESDDVLPWLLGEFDATADRTGFGVLRRLVRIGRRTRTVAQTFPRYLFVCGRSPVATRPDAPVTDVVSVAGKNRTSVLELDEGILAAVRKIPNSRRHAAANEAADRATRTASSVSSVSATIPNARTRTTVFGPERVERPVDGRPLDSVLSRDPERFERILDVAFDWLQRLHLGTQSGVVRKEPADVVSDLALDRLGLTDPPGVDRPIELPQVLTHGDYFGSNIYVDTETDDWEVTGVIDWEWASVEGIPIVDAGFVALQSATSLWDGFETGFARLFLDRNPYSSVVYEDLAEYGVTIGVDARAMATYLAIGYVERVRTEGQLNGRLDIEWDARIRNVWDHRETIERRIRTCSGGIESPKRPRRRR
ncbi:phosphotransferase [Halovivax cerinus]|uniref:Phosphotransferase n=1 Tax=Halovivax cerinus TaxID=1487865 RepID=A0ABD5NNL5_9EURY|nr:phosphotransferase [Halovivax cerinus]